MNKANATNRSKIKTFGIERYVPHYTPTVPQQAKLSKQILSKVPTDFQYVERSNFMKEINTRNLSIFELGNEDGINVPILIISTKR